MLYSSELIKSSSWYIVEALVVKWREECGSLRVYIACKTLCLSTVEVENQLEGAKSSGQDRQKSCGSDGEIGGQTGD